MSTCDAYQALVIDRGTVLYRHTTRVPSHAWAALTEYAHGIGDNATAQSLHRQMDYGRDTVRLARRYNGRELIYQVQVAEVNAKGNLFDAMA